MSEVETPVGMILSEDGNTLIWNGIVYIREDERKTVAALEDEHGILSEGVILVHSVTGNVMRSREANRYFSQEGEMSFEQRFVMVEAETESVDHIYLPTSFDGWVVVSVPDVAVVEE